MSVAPSGRVSSTCEASPLPHGHPCHATPPMRARHALSGAHDPRMHVCMLIAEAVALCADWSFSILQCVVGKARTLVTGNLPQGRTPHQLQCRANHLHGR